MKEYTPDELAGYNGAEGKPIYIAHDGKVYDVSESKLWRNGVHMKRHHAGNDLTHGQLGRQQAQRLYPGSAGASRPWCDKRMR